MSRTFWRLEKLSTLVSVLFGSKLFGLDTIDYSWHIYIYVSRHVLFVFVQCPQTSLLLGLTPFINVFFPNSKLFLMSNFKQEKEKEEPIAWQKIFVMLADTKSPTIWHLVSSLVQESTGLLFVQLITIQAFLDFCC